MKFVLSGQPNSGKSTVFNAVAGYRSATANFPGSSVSYTISRALILGREVEIVDLPGVYSLTSTDAAVSEAESYLLDQNYDLIIDVVDASRLGRSLELTLQLLELGRPMVIALNMMDEAERRGIEIDVNELSRQLGVPVVPTIASRGRGLRALFRAALQKANSRMSPEPVHLDREVEGAVEAVAGLIRQQGIEIGVPPRFTAGKLIEGDAFFRKKVYGWYPDLQTSVVVSFSGRLGCLTRAPGLRPFLLEFDGSEFPLSPDTPVCQVHPDGSRIVREMNVSPDSLEDAGLPQRIGDSRCKPASLVEGPCLVRQSLYEL